MYLSSDEIEEDLRSSVARLSKRLSDIGCAYTPGGYGYVLWVEACLE